MEAICHVLFLYLHVFYYLIIDLLEGVTDLIVYVTTTNTVTTTMIIYQNNIGNKILSKNTTSYMNC